MKDHSKGPTNDVAPAADGTCPDKGACDASLWSVSPGGERFQLPASADYAGELQRLEGLAGVARAEGKEIVVVLGVGFVGSVMAAIIADTVDKKTGGPSKFVIGCEVKALGRGHIQRIKQEVKGHGEHPGARLQ